MVANQTKQNDSATRDLLLVVAHEMAVSQIDNIYPIFMNECHCRKSNVMLKVIVIVLMCS